MLVGAKNFIYQKSDELQEKNDATPAQILFLVDDINKIIEYPNQALNNFEE
jgi:glycyl-tRNA synthetase beta subunit